MDNFHVMGLSAKSAGKIIHKSSVVFCQMLNPRRAGGGGVSTPPSCFSQIAKKRRRAAPPYFAYLFLHPSRTPPENFIPRSFQVSSPGQFK